MTLLTPGVFKSTRTLQVVKVVDIHPVSVDVLHLGRMSVLRQLVKGKRKAKTEESQ